MLHLLKIEWLKVKNYRTFWVLFILYLVAIVGLNYMVYQVLEINLEEDMRKNPTSAFIRMMIGTPPYSFPTVWPMTAYVSSFLFVIPGFLTIILFTNEFSYKTHRQNLIDGYTRSQFISSKILSILCITTIATIVVGLTALMFGLNGTKPFDGNLAARNLLLAFLQGFSYCMLALMLGTIFRRSAIALGIFFIYVAIFDNVLFQVLNRYANNTGWFLPAESADNLIPLPIVEEGQKNIIVRPEFTYILISCLTYLILYFIITFRKFKTDDL